jgi:hypothetical protein
MTENTLPSADFIEALKELLVKQLLNVEHLKIEQIVALAEQYAPVFSLGKDELDSVISYVQSRLVHTMNEGVSIIDNSTDHDEDWYQKREISFNYWEDYQRQLITEDWPPRVVNTLGDVTHKILGLLKDPADSSEKDRRGLVIGHVQSGKTANYIGLVTKAADAGYKFIIVIAGIHNNLRKQTQQRIDEGFVGRDSTPDTGRKLIGVGILNKNRKFPVSLTNTSQDFTKQIANQLAADLEGFSQPVVVVIKKNVTTLQNLYSWLKELNTRAGAERIANVPMLMIDDEADNASINTNKEDLDPTRTNQEIRKILKLFKKHCYVGYTATPFANIFINPDSEDEMLHDDLFPRDFIYCLDAPTNYFGAQRVFLDEEKSEKILETIGDAEPYIPINHKTKDQQIDEIPPSLREAIRVFIVAKAIRILRGQAGKHATMMVNVSRFVNVQKQVREIISFYLDTLKREVRYNHSLPVATALKNESIRELKAAFDEFYSESNVEWPEVQRVLTDAIDSIKLFVVNSKSDEALDYKKAADNKESLTALAIGGLSLSRGLTLEGLMVSYMYRNTKMYDTLMQMGRWFGYRPGYDDLCKVWLSDDSQGWYVYISSATEELRSRIKQMRRDGLNPKQFGLYVRAHHQVLTVTATNKMRDTEIRPLQISFSGDLKETHIIPSDAKITAENQKVVRELFNKLKKENPEKQQNIDNTIFWESVNWEIVDEFLFKYRYHRVLQSEKVAVRDYLKEVSGKYPTVDIAFISLKREKPEQSRFVFDENDYILCQERAVGSKDGEEEYTRIIKDTPEEPGYYVTNKQRVASRGSEIIGLSPAEIKAAQEFAVNDGDNMADKHYRFVRGRPLLMIHVLDLVHKPSKTGESNPLISHVPAIGMAFPDGDYGYLVSYVVNKVWINLNKQENFDTPDNEDDYDE